MKKSFILATIAASSLFITSCLEDEAVPVPLPPPPPQMATEAVDLPPPPDTLADSSTVSALDTTSVPSTAPVPVAEPAPVEKQAAIPAAPAVKELPPPPVFTSEIGQLNSGRYTIQVGAHETEKVAQNMVKKLAENKINAYYAHVSNPARLQGSYYRVRVGYFAGKSVAEEFARTRLTPLNYKWWVDMSHNDAVGTPASSAPVQSSPKETGKAPAKAATATSSKSSSQEEEAKKAALEAAKADYKAFAEKADKESKAKAPPPPPVPKTAEKAASKSVEVKGGQVKIK